MTDPKLLIPLRVPELGPSLGKLITARRDGSAEIRLDEFRFQLVTKILESAGEARRLAATGQRAAAISALGRAAWLGAWEETVAALGERLAVRVAKRLEAEAIAVRMPQRVRREVALEATERRAIAARLGSAGAHLVSALDELESRAEAALSATGLERDIMDDWHAALHAAARKLEAAWLDLEVVVVEEQARWEQVVDEVAEWRKPMWPVYAFGVVASAAAIWLGLVMGGQIGTPAWLAKIWGTPFGP